MSPRVRFSIIAALILMVSGALALLLLTVLHQSLGRAAVEHFDLQVQTRVHGWTSPLLTALMLALTWLGAIKIFAAALALVVVCLSIRRRLREALLLGGGMAGAFVLNESLKLHFHRLRPQVPWSIGDEHTFSFPSGHSLFAVALYGTLAYLFLRRGIPAWRRFGTVLLAMLMPLGIGLSRIYLGMHFPTDVLAGWIAGTLWLGAILMIDKAWRGESRRSGETQDLNNSHPSSRYT